MKLEFYFRTALEIATLILFFGGMFALYIAIFAGS